MHTCRLMHSVNRLSWILCLSYLTGRELQSVCVRLSVVDISKHYISNIQHIVHFNAFYCAMQWFISFCASCVAMSVDNSSECKIWTNVSQSVCRGTALWLEKLEVPIAIIIIMQLGHTWSVPSSWTVCRSLHLNRGLPVSYSFCFFLLVISSGSVCRPVHPVA
jgi:hypothetical protein